MKYLVTAKEMKYYDNYTITKVGIPSLVLMERAAFSVCQILLQKENRNLFDAKYALVCCGTGNNGADGLALARMLSEAGWTVEVFVAGNRDRATEAFTVQENIIKHYKNVSVIDKMDTDKYDVIIDALLGVGLSRPITGELMEVVSAMNHLKGYKVAVDIPTGLNADNGEIMGICFQADLTVTFGFEKRGLRLFPGCEYCGEIVPADIGIASEGVEESSPEMFYLDEPIETLLPNRRKDGNKGTFGKLLMIAGSYNMAGAAILSGKAAYRSGTGMVKLISPECNREIIQTSLPEALLGNENDFDTSAKWADGIVIGPGLGKSESAAELLESVIRDTNHSVVIDADGLNLLADSEELALLIKEKSENRTIIMTPHLGEAARLLGCSVKDIKADPVACGKRLVEKYGAIVVLKDARTMVFAKNHKICINLSGNSGMATAGSGDVLAGIIGGLLVQGMDGYDAACIGVNLHGYLGDMVSKEYGEHACMAGDLVKADIW